MNALLKIYFKEKKLTKYFESKVEKQDRKYEQDFYKKVLLSMLAFAVLAVASAFAVQFIVSEPIAPVSTKLDPQTLGNFFIFVFATSVAFAGALVVIRIASNQEKLAKGQLALAAKTTPEYLHAHESGTAVLDGIQTVSLQLKMLLSIYRTNKQDLSKFLKNTKGAETLLKNCSAELQKPWVNDLAQYAIAKNSANVNDSTSQINLLSNVTALFDSCQKLLSKLEEKAITQDKVEIQFSQTINDAQKLMEGLLDLKNKHAEQIKLGGAKEFNDATPTAAAYIHKLLQTLDFDSLKISSDVEKAVYKSEHFKNVNHAFFKCTAHDLQNKLSINFKKLNADDESYAKLEYIEHAYNDAATFEAVRDAFGSAGKDSVSFMQGIQTKINLEALINNIKENQKCLYIIYMAENFNPKYLFANSDLLDRCVIILDGFPNPSWLNEFKDYGIDEIFTQTAFKNVHLKSKDEQWAEYLSNVRNKVDFWNKQMKNNIREEQAHLEKPVHSRTHWIVLNKLPDPTDVDACNKHIETMLGWVSNIPVIATSSDLNENHAWKTI